MTCLPSPAALSQPSSDPLPSGGAHSLDSRREKALVGFTESSDEQLCAWLHGDLADEFGVP